MSTEKIYTQHQENQSWHQKMSFYKDEIKVLQNRLGEVVNKNTSKDMLAQAEHFQNRFIVFKNNIDELNHKINLSEDQLMLSIKQNPTAVDHRKVEDHREVREEVTVIDKSFTDLRSEVNTYLSKWM
jgi:NAD-dependent SIR2 family protein deacetylase